MMANHAGEIGTIAGTAGGTMLSIWGNISSGDILHTSILAAIGAVISFIVSVLLKALLQWLKRKHPPPKGM